MKELGILAITSYRDFVKVQAVELKYVLRSTVRKCFMVYSLTGFVTETTKT